MADSPRWRATLAEHRTAWLISTASLILVLLAMFWPGIFDFQSTSERSIEASIDESAAKPDGPTYSAIAPDNVNATPPSRESEDISALPGHASHPLPPQTAPESQPLIKPATTSNPTPVKKIQPENAIPATGTYYVQTGAFKEKAHADKLAANINSNGWTAKVVKKPGDLFAVWVGPRETRSLASILQDSLQKRLHLKGFIIQKKPS